MYPHTPSTEVAPPPPGQKRSVPLTDELYLTKNGQKRDKSLSLSQPLLVENLLICSLKALKEEGNTDYLEKYLPSVELFIFVSFETHFQGERLVEQKLRRVWIGHFEKSMI